ncbi:MAG: hydroxymethylglutaryl-CoA reductase, degradative [Deltaproteobacteria bacterium]|nr:hydroxymethylglutaryl-CoA reductase, degradative [Deltaproteobacteria bacterium]
MNILRNFSKLSWQEKVETLSRDTSLSDELKERLRKFRHEDDTIQSSIDRISENVLSSFYLPYSIAPNFLINGQVYHVPMVTEESSVVAAASKGAKLWAERGGFQAEIVNTLKVGHVHLKSSAPFAMLSEFFETSRNAIVGEMSPLTEKMERRGGGIRRIHLVDTSAKIEHYYQIRFEVDTCDAMGANFINSLLETYALKFKEKASTWPKFDQGGHDIQIVMAILSNYTPECLVKAKISCPIEELRFDPTLTEHEYCEKFNFAVKIANITPDRAVTHNKGIFNGIDAVILATGNDFRSVEACGHAYACRKGSYQALTTVFVENREFHYELEIPLALGTIGGLTRNHPLVQISMELLRNPSAKELMAIVASVGLSQNFSAVNSLITSGIQKGHMKLHIRNIFEQLQVGKEEQEILLAHFKEKTVSYHEVRTTLGLIQNLQKTG